VNRHFITSTLVFTLVAMGGCPSDTGDGPVPHVSPDADATATPAELPTVGPLPGATVGHDFTRSGGFFSAPFPSEDLRTSHGGVSLAGFPNGPDTTMIHHLVDALERDAEGFSSTAPIFVQLSDAPDPATLPTAAASVRDDAAVMLLDVDPESPAWGTRYAIDTHFSADPGPYGASNLMAALPVQGIVPRPGTRHALVLTTGLKSVDGAAFGRDQALVDLLNGDPVPGMAAAARDQYHEAVAALGELGVKIDDIVGLSVFVTDDPAAQFRRFVDHMLAQPLPSPTGIEAHEVFDDFCVYQGTFEVPNYQHGIAPYDTPEEGGGWAVDANGVPLPAGTETSRIVFTIPRAPMPTDGYPLVVAIRTGGGGDRPLVDRGPRASNGGPSIDPGTGPGLHFARAGFAGVTFDGPHGGPRNASGGNEQFLIFNIANAVAMRENIRQTALESVLVPYMLEGVALDTSDCPGASPSATFDVRPGKVALFGHSMGATIGPLALATDPVFGAAVFSGAGGSWIENVMYKEKPLEVRPLAELLLGYTGKRDLTRFDPALALLQWALEGADPPPYASSIIDEAERFGASPRHVLMLQGVVDRYLLPPIANAMSLSAGLELAGPALDEVVEEVDMHRPLRELLPLAPQGLTTRDYPVSANRRGATALVTQFEEDGIEDGHEVAFQLPGPKVQYECFLATWLTRGTPTVPAPDHEGACP